MILFNLSKTQYTLKKGHLLERTEIYVIQSKFSEIYQIHLITKIPIISRNCINYRDVTEHDLGQVFVDVTATRRLSELLTLSYGQISASCLRTSKTEQ